MDQEKSLTVFFEADVETVKTLVPKIVLDFFDIMGILPVSHTVKVYDMEFPTNSPTSRRLLYATDSGNTVLVVEFKAEKSSTWNEFLFEDNFLYVAIGGG